MEWRGREWRGGQGRAGQGRAGQGRAWQGSVPDCLGGLSRVGISSRSTRPWNGQPPSSTNVSESVSRWKCVQINHMFLENACRPCAYMGWKRMGPIRWDDGITASLNLHLYIRRITNGKMAGIALEDEIPRRTH